MPDHARCLDGGGDVGGAAADVAAAQHALQDRLRLDAVLERHDGSVGGQQRLDDRRRLGQVVHLDGDQHDVDQARAAPPTRIAYVDVLPDEKKESAKAFLERALRWLKQQRIDVQQVMTDNGACYRSKLFTQALCDAHIRHLRTRPYTPRTNGKAERFIQTLLREWAYARAYQNSGRRNAALAPFVHRYNHHRPHASLAGQSPAHALSRKR